MLVVNFSSNHTHQLEHGAILFYRHEQRHLHFVYIQIEIMADEIHNHEVFSHFLGCPQNVRSGFEINFGRFLHGTFYRTEFNLAFSSTSLLP